MAYFGLCSGWNKTGCTATGTLPETDGRNLKHSESKNTAFWKHIGYNNSGGGEPDENLIPVGSVLVITAPVFAELTPEDIRIIREEVTKIVKAENAELEKRMQTYVDLKFEVLDTKFTTKLTELDTKFTTKLAELDTKFTTKLEDVEKRQMFILILVTGLIALIVLAVGIPQIIIALKQKDHGALEAQIRSLQEKVELLEQTQLAKPR